MANDAYIPDYEEEPDESEREAIDAEDALQSHKRADYRERMFDLADHIRDTERDDRLTGDL